jgi:hypothetical protein
MLLSLVCSHLRSDVFIVTTDATGELWLRLSLKMRATLETLSSKSTKSTKRTLNLYFQTRDQPCAASDLPWRRNASENA